MQVVCGIPFISCLRQEDHSKIGSNEKRIDQMKQTGIMGLLDC